ncbi:MAG: methionyl-tRNA formyltransferase, partial [Bacteroidales bacterium]|nr:methionyl-tRNA formyltransferase [Bacteroidales bacterium]
VIRWEDTTKNVNNFVRGLSPYPAARTTLVHGEGRLEMKVYEAEILPVSSMVAPLPAPGTVETDGKTFLHVATSDGMVALHRLQPAGKRPMSVADFLRGFHHAGGSHFE